MLMNITSHSVEVIRLEFMNQILDIVCLLAIFIQTHWTSSGSYGDELVELIDGDDWSIVNWQGMGCLRSINQNLHCKK